MALDLDAGQPQNQAKVSLFWQVLLTATVFGLETSLGFYQIYAILFLQYMGVPVSLVSLDGIVTGAFCLGVVPFMGYLSDKGANPKTRKWWALLFGKGLLLLGILLFFVATSLNLQELIEQQEYLNLQQENGSIHFQNSTTTQKIARPAHEETPMYTFPVHYSYRSSMSSASLWPTDAPQVWEISMAAVLAILCVSFFNIGYDCCASMSRAFLLVCVPTNQQSGILIMATIFQSLSGTIFSSLGTIDLPRFLGPLFGVDGISISFLLFAVYMFVCVVAGFIITSVASHHVDRMLRDYQTLADKWESECKNHQLSADKKRSVCFSESEVISHNFGKGTITGVEDRENIPILPNFNSNSEHTYSSITRDTIYISHSDMPETQSGHSRSNVETYPDVIESQSVSPHGDDTKLRLNKKLVVLCLGHFFGVGGLVSMVEYMPNTLTIGIYHGDPTAFPGTEKHALYQKGLKMAALGNLLFYVTYLLISLGTKRVLKYIDTEMLHVILSSSFLVVFAALLIFQHEALYFLNAIAFGPYRTCVFTNPYLLAAKYNQENQVDPQRQAKNIGKVMSLIGILMPLHYFVLSTFMGPAMDKTNDVWFPLYYSFSNFCLSLLFFGLLLFWSRMKQKR